jgi:hypothetical protein
MSITLNFCDKCRQKENTEHLIWITSEDFEPFEGEVLTEEAKGYDALCEYCYSQVITIEPKEATK